MYTIVVVSRSAPLLNELRTLLGAYGAVVVAAAGCDAALDVLYRLHSCDAVVCDGDLDERTTLLRRLQRDLRFEGLQVLRAPRGLGAQSPAGRVGAYSFLDAVAAACATQHRMSTERAIQASRDVAAPAARADRPASLVPAAN